MSRCSKLGPQWVPSWSFSWGPWLRAPPHGEPGAGAQDVPENEDGSGRGNPEQRWFWRTKFCVSSIPKGF